MIVRDKPRPWELLFIMRGSIVPTIWPQVLVTTCIAGIVVALEARGLMHTPPTGTLPFSLIGIALSIFAGFRNSASYDRWWEARKVLGQLVVEARSLSRQALAHAGGEGRHIARQTIAFSHALRCHLRDMAPDEAALRHLAPDERAALTASCNPPSRVLSMVSGEVAALIAAGTLSPQMAQVLEERLAAMSGVLAAAERIKLTPLPYAYSLLLHRTAYLFCFLLPFGILDTAGLWTPLVAAIVAYTFFGLDALGDELAVPFGTAANGLPLDAITRTIEINILEQLGETDLPAPLQPERYALR